MRIRLLRDGVPALTVARLDETTVLVTDLATSESRTFEAAPDHILHWMVLYDEADVAALNLLETLGSATESFALKFVGGQWLTTDGMKFPSRSEAIKHQQQLDAEIPAKGHGSGLHPPTEDVRIANVGTYDLPMGPMYRAKPPQYGSRKRKKYGEDPGDSFGGSSSGTPSPTDTSTQAATPPVGGKQPITKDSAGRLAKVGYMGPDMGPFSCGHCEHFQSSGTEAVLGDDGGGSGMCNHPEVQSKVDAQGCCNEYSPVSYASQVLNANPGASPGDGIVA